MKQWIDLTIGVLVSISLLAAAGFFYVEIRRDEAVTAQYRRTVEAIEATRMLASQWSIEVEKVRNEVNSNFDVLAGFIDRMDRHVSIIRETPKVLPQLPASVKWSLNGYVQRLKAQEERIERFKSGFAIVRNSRRFIPREGGELAEAARDGGRGKVETATQQIMAETEDFLRRPTEIQRQRMERTVRALAESAGGTALRTQADTLSKHVRALLRHYGLTEQRFRDIMGSDLESRSGHAIDLLDADHARSRAMRRYFDYGLLLSLGFAVSYWGFLIMRWMGRRKRSRTDERAPEAVAQERVVPTLDMGAAWAAAGAPPGAPLPAGLPPGAGTAEPQGPPAQARRVRNRGAGQARAKFAAGGRPGLSLAERLRARSEPRPAEREEPAHEERRPPAQEEDDPGVRIADPSPAAEARAGEPGRWREEDVDEAARTRQAPGIFAHAGAASAAWDAAGEEGRTPGDREAPAGERPERAAEAYRKTEGGSPPGAGRGGALAARLEALDGEIRSTREEPGMVRERGAAPGSAQQRDAGRTGSGPAPAEDGRPMQGGSLAARLEALDGEIRSTGEGPGVVRERGADPASAQERNAGRTGSGPGPAPADGDRTFEGEGPDHPSAPDAGRMGGAPAQWIGATAGRAPPDGAELVHWAIRESVLERLREVEREVRAAADAAGRAERASTGGNGEGRQDAWAAAAGRMAGVRWEVRTLLEEAGRLPSVPAPARDPEPIDLRPLLDARLDALAAEDRERIGATLAPQAVTRGDPRALDGVVELILQHALEGARLHPRGQGHVTVTLAEEHGGVHLTCLDHGAGNAAPGERPGLALAAARRLAEEQDATMEVTPYPGHGAMIRLRLPLHRSPAAQLAPAGGAGGEGRDGGAASRERSWPHE